MLTKEEIVRKVSEVPFWGQSIPLAEGIITPGRVSDNLETWKRLKLPNDLSGKTVLDIGCWDGFYSFECEKRGAKVLAIDNCERMKRLNERQYAYLGNKGFEVAKEILQSQVEFKFMDVHNISPENIGKFDIALFLGVLYHMKCPLLALEKISKVTKELLIVESEYLKIPTRVPLLRYTEGNSYNQDPTVWFIPNEACIKGMLRDAGFKKIETIFKSHTSLKGATKFMLQLGYNSGRIILEAYK
jgi:tRNA (mo5U34)-methyltransferase